MNIDKYKNDSIEISKLGLGCMRMSVNLKSRRTESIATIHKALDSGINFINTGDFYGIAGHNEKLISEALKGYRREQAFISLKYGGVNLLRGFSHMDVGPKNIKKYITKSLKRLNLDYVDLYQPARIDKGIPIEETIGAISELVDAGYVKNIGLSEVDSDTLRKANDIHKISLVESEISILSNDIKTDLIPVAKELGIGVIAFGALGFGKLVRAKDDSLVKVLQVIANEKNATISQLAHAWLLTKGDNVIPLIGARKVVQLLDSMQCLNINFTPEDIVRIEEAMKTSEIMGRRMDNFIIENGKVVKIK